MMKWLSILGSGAVTAIVALCACDGGHDVPLGELPASGGALGTGGSATTGGNGNTGTGGTTSAYQPCAGKNCGDSCTICAPNDTNCGETAIVKNCNPSGQCVVGSQCPPTQYTVDASTVITLARTVCYGTCPAYSLRIVGDGSVTYQGTNYVKVLGAASEQIPVSDVQALVDQMMQANYFGLSVPDSCPQGINTDAPDYTTSLTLSGQTHTVPHYAGNQCAPAVLTTLENRIDEITNSAQGVKCDTAGGYCTN